jgi:hypothetical protein
MVKNKGNYGPRKRTRGSAMESARPAKLSKVKYGTLSRKDREFVEQYGQMEEDVLLSDQADELNDASTMDHQRISL